MCECESWTIKKAEHFRLMLLNCGVGEDSLRVPWTTRRSNLSILKEISPEYSLEGLMLKLKLQYFVYLMWKTSSLEKTLRLGRIERRRRRDEMIGWHHRLNGHEFEQTPGDGEGQGSLICCGPWGRKVSDTTERLNKNMYMCNIWNIRKSESDSCSVMSTTHRSPMDCSPPGFSVHEIL